jgi:hypothetical protein
MGIASLLRGLEKGVPPLMAFSVRVVGWLCEEVTGWAASGRFMQTTTPTFASIFDAS